MPHRLYDWRVRVKAVEREYRAVRVALDLLGSATDGDLLGLTEERGWDQLAATEIDAAERNLEATYLSRMYSVFERAVGSFWRQLPGDSTTPGDGDRMLDEVGYAQLVGRWRRDRISTRGQTASQQPGPSPDRGVCRGYESRSRKPRSFGLSQPTAGHLGLIRRRGMADLRFLPRPAAFARRGWSGRA